MKKYEVPEGSKIITVIWGYKCKRFIDGGIWKFKAQFCVRVDIQKRLSDVPINSYAPMVQWSTARLMLVLACIMGLNTQATNFRNYFNQA